MGSCWLAGSDDKADQDQEATSGEVMGPPPLMPNMRQPWLGTNSSNPVPTITQLVNAEPRVGVTLASTQVGGSSSHRCNLSIPSIALFHLVEAEGTSSQELQDTENVLERHK